MPLTCHRHPSPVRPPVFTATQLRGPLLLGLILTAFAFPRTTAGADERTPPSDPFPQAVKVPPGILDGGTEWLNTSRPLDLKDLRGKVVLLDFWTYCCINCIHVLPDLKFLEEKYANELVVIGVHSAKFDNEKLSENIRDAILRYEIKHPVVNDSEMLIWRRFGTRAWPTLALIDPEGRFIGRQGGEGHRELFDGIIQQLVDYHRAKGTLDETPLVFDLESRKAAPTALRFPGKVLADESSGRVFISDSNHNRIVVTDMDGTVRQTIGAGQMGQQDGSFAEATFDHPQGMALVKNRLYIADTENHMIRMADLSTQTVTTLSGTGKQGTPRLVDGRLKFTKLNSPWDLLHHDGVLYIAMAGPHQIWSHTLGSDRIGVYAGNAREDIINGSLPGSSFAQPSGLTIDQKGEFIYVADSEGSAIRRLPTDANGQVTTVAGTSELPRGQSLFAFGDVDARGAKARFQHPLGVAWYEDAVYVADAYNHKIRRIDLADGAVTTFLGTGKAGAGSDPVQLSEPAGVSLSGDWLYIADTNNHRICRVHLKTKEFSVLPMKGLEPPAPPATTPAPSLTDAIAVPEQSVGVSPELTVQIELNVPDGYKLNDLAPVTATLFMEEGDAILPPDQLGRRIAAEVANGMATFSVPGLEVEGKASLVVEVSYGYCEKEDGVCRLASQVFQLPVIMAADAEQKVLQLAFPDRSLSLNSDSN